MTTFVEAIDAQTTRTENGMMAFKSSLNSSVDLFFKIGALRGKNPVADFESAFQEDRNLALRIALWARDARDGAGERKIFRDIVEHLDNTYPDELRKIMHLIPLVGRWDDLLVIKSRENRLIAVNMIRDALQDGNALAAKWMPREKSSNKENQRKAKALARDLGLSSKAYRKTLAMLSNTVEQQMCAKEWKKINFSQVPSLAAARYKKAFNRHAPDEYQKYVDALARNDGSAKVNAGAVYPYDVLKGLNYYGYGNMFDTKEKQVIRSQWDALPNYVGDAKILPVVDVSGSMYTNVSPTVKAVDVSISLGLYLADKNKGVFKDAMLCFSEKPKLFHFKGDVVSKVEQLSGQSDFMGFSTDLEKAMNEVLRVATQNNVPQHEMPEYLLILSDMQFNQGMRSTDTAMDMIRSRFSNAGYKTPQVVYWNLCDRGNNMPVRFNEKGTALVSGFSPAIVKAVLQGDMDPMKILLNAVMTEKYNFEGSTVTVSK